MDTLIDKLAKERAIVQATIKENKRHEASIQRILEEHGFNRLAPPQKGVDYFTPSEIEAMRQSIAALIPKPKDGVSPIVDYNTIFEYCFSEIVKRVDAIPPPKDGKQGPAGPKGDNATLDIQELVKQVLTALPTQKDKKLVIDRDQIIKLIDDSNRF